MNRKGWRVLVVLGLSVFTSSAEAGWFCGDRGGCEGRSFRVGCPLTYQAPCRPVVYAFPFQQEVMVAAPQPIADPNASVPAGVTLTSAIVSKSGRPSAYEWNPNLGRSGRTNRGGSASALVYPEIATPNPLTGGAIGFGGGSGGGGSGSSASPNLAESAVEGVSSHEGYFTIGRPFDWWDKSQGLAPASLSLGDPGTITDLDPPGGLALSVPDLSEGAGLDDPSSFPGPSPTDHGSPEPLVAASPKVSAVPEPAAIVSTLTGLLLVALTRYIQKLNRI